MAQVKSLQGWKTVIFNVAVALAAATDALTDGQIIGALVNDPKKAAAVVGLIAVVNLVLRKLTTTPIGEKE